jgi:FkbM family methyltransferase
MRLSRFHCPLEEAHFYYRYLLGIHEPGTTGSIKNSVRAGMTVIDVGAHFGYFSVLFAKYVGTHGRVYAFEPDPRSFAILAQNTKNFKNVIPLNAAVLDRDATVTLYRSKQSSHNSLWEDNVDLPAGSVSVKAVRLDQVLDDVCPDFVKIDAEGCELEVLDSMSALLERSPTTTLLVELNPLRMNGRGRSPADLLQKLLTLRFRICFVNERTGRVEPVNNSLSDLKAYVSRLGHADYVNLLCTREDGGKGYGSSPMRIVA